MEDYWSMDLTFINLQDSRGWTAELSTYDRTQGRKKSVNWLLGHTLTEHDLVAMIAVMETIITARMDVQLGLDLGLIS